jgi:hypothetical protein
MAPRTARIGKDDKQERFMDSAHLDLHSLP